ncbi:MAG TPA: NAD(P)-dependent oxidoreductase [Chloroflexota bacterium]|nr:NAD(P)-dependent oxidoreductase [Chloroflexota bacterium]
MTTLITGGSGFIGVRLAARLQAVGERVVLVDRRFDPDGLAKLQPGYEAIESDVTSFEKVLGLVEAIRPDGIVHLAAILSGQCEKDPAAAFAINVAGTFHVLEAARRSGVQKVVATSSAAVLEAPRPVPPLDEDTPLVPSGVYAMTKTVGEEWCKFYHRRYGLDTRVARPGAVIGPGRAATGAASNWTTGIVEEPLRGRPFVCPVGEDDSSPLVYHTDLVDGLFRLYRAARVPARVYNLGAFSATAGSMAEAVRARLPRAEIAFQPDPVATYVVGLWRHSLQDNRRAGRDLGYQPLVTSPEAAVAACAAELGIGR